MPWNDNTGNGSGGSGGPWGQRPSGGGPRGGGSQPPDLEDIIRRGQDRFRRAFPGGNMGGGSVLVGILIIAMVWLLTGIYTVQPDEQGVVLRFGKAVRTTKPGLHYHLPYPIERVLTPSVTKNRQIDIGTIVGGTPNDREGLMLTGDENIAYIEFSVNWRIKSDEIIPGTNKSGTYAYLFNVEDPDDTVRAVAESAMREVVGRNNMDFIRTRGRGKIQEDTQKIIQNVLDYYNAGIRITQVQITQTPPPAPVKEAFQDLVAARQDKERFENEAQRYQNKEVPEACGQAFGVLQKAEAYRQQTVEEAIGQAARFSAIYSEYKQAKDVTRERMFLETMERVMGGMNKVIIDQEGQSSGVVPYLPLNELQQKSTATGEAQ